ncbi:hypothetical protein ACE6H2_018757 [Prunus campanulata]
MQMKISYLYLHYTERLYRLNLTKLLETSSNPSERPHIEVVHDFSAHRSPVGMSSVILGSKLYFVGGERLDMDTSTPDFWSIPISRADAKNCTNLDLFVYDTECLSICPYNVKVPRLGGPMSYPIVVTLEGKIYVMERRPYFGCRENFSHPIFVVFNPTTGFWRSLTPPPFYKPFSREWKDDDLIMNHYAWGNKLAIVTNKSSYIFDAHQEAWREVDDLPNIYSCVEFKGFLIGMLVGVTNLISFELDDNGLPHSSNYHVLPELRIIFCPPLHNHSPGFVIPLDGDGSRMCFVYVGEDGTFERSFARLAMVKLHISTCIGRQKVTAVLEGLHSFDCNGLQLSGQTLLSSFIKCDHLDKHGIEADASCLSPSTRP